MSKSSVSRGRVCALCMVPVLVVAAGAFLMRGPVKLVSAAKRAAAPNSTSPLNAASSGARGRIKATYSALPLAFEQNQGQTDSRVKYMARGDGYTLFLTSHEAVFALGSKSAKPDGASLRRKSVVPGASVPEFESQKTKEDPTAVVRMQLAGGNSAALVSASVVMPGRSNYFLGNDPSKWHPNVPHFARVSYRDVYPGVNLAFHGAQRQAEFDFIVAPEASAAPIAFRFRGTRGIRKDDAGNLVISSAADDVQLHKPVAYQEVNGARQSVEAGFVLAAGNRVSFELGSYDHSRELVIDPSVSYLYSTYLGGSGADAGQAIAFDNMGAAYVTGQTASANFPGAGNSLLGTANVFVTKISPDGSSLDYSTYIGGSGTLGDSGNAIAVNAMSEVAYIAGGTTSTNFPTTSGVFQPHLKGTTGNAFVCELSSTGAITYCTYLGGTGDDTAFGVALASNGSGDVIVVGKAQSTDFPPFPVNSPLQGFVIGSTSSGFITKLDSTASNLIFSTYIGGSSTGDLAGGVAVDSSDNVYVTGQTFSTTFPTKNPLQSSCGSCSDGNSNAFVTEINAAGNAYVYSTYLGGAGSDAGDGIAADSTGAYVVGTTTSSGFPTITGGLQTTYGGGTDAFISKLNPGGSALLYSTYLGGSGFEAGASIGIDGQNNAYVTGQTNSNNFPVGGATQSAIGGGYDAFVAEINASGTQVVFSTYLGGSSNEDVGGNYGAIAVDSAGANIYVTGNTGSSNFPTHGTPPYSGGGSNAGSTDAFVVKYSQPVTASFTLSATALSPASVSPGSSATSTVTVTGNNGFSGSVTLACTVSGPSGAADLPTCSGSASTGTSGTLTVSTTGTSALLQPATRSSGMFYALLLPVGGLVLFGIGASPARRKRLFGLMLLGLMLSGLILMPACGGGSSGSGGGGGSGGTTAGSYTVTVTGSATGASQNGASPALSLTVN